jgi:hypothetical protein
LARVSLCVCVYVFISVHRSATREAVTFALELVSRSCEQLIFTRLTVHFRSFFLFTVFVFTAHIHKAYCSFSQNIHMHSQTRMQSTQTHRHTDTHVYTRTNTYRQCQRATEGKKPGGMLDLHLILESLDFTLLLVEPDS